MKTLRKNQILAIESSIKNDFQSGVHFHATGTGKSWIAFELVLRFIEKYPASNILWLCEQKTILNQQFNRNNLKLNGYETILRKFLIIDYTTHKTKDWYSKINMAKIWKKPLLIVINRAFLVSKLKYKLININLNLIIHDECHSIINKTTTEFYKYIINKFPSIKCLGFSATPHLKIKPYDNLISKYTIYDAFVDEVIVQPKIKFVKSKQILQDNDFLELCKKLIKPLPLKK